MARFDLVRRKNRPGERGFILIVVMIFAALLASVLVGVMRTSTSYIYATAVYSDSTRANELGRSATDLVAQRVLLSDATARRGGAFSVRLPDASVSVSYLSESARVDLNTTQPELLIALMKAAGVDPGQANAVGARITAWFAQNIPATDQNGQPTEASSQALSAATNGPRALGAAPMAAPSAPTVPLRHLDHVSQCLTAWRMPAEILASIEPYITVSNPTGKIDPTLASPIVIKAILGDELAANDYLRRRERGFATQPEALMPIPLGARGYVGFNPGVAFRALIRVQFRDRVARRYETVVVPPRKHGDAVQVTEWHAL